MILNWTCPQPHQLATYVKPLEIRLLDNTLRKALVPEVDIEISDSDEARRGRLQVLEDAALKAIIISCELDERFERFLIKLSDITCTAQRKRRY